MDLNNAIDWSRKSLRMALILGGPLLAAALLVGLVDWHWPDLDPVARACRRLVPRLLAVGLVLFLILPWLLGRWVSFAVDLIGSIPDMI